MEMLWQTNQMIPICHTDTYDVYAYAFLLKYGNIVNPLSF